MTQERRQGLLELGPQPFESNATIVHQYQSLERGGGTFDVSRFTRR